MGSFPSHSLAQFDETAGSTLNRPLVCLRCRILMKIDATGKVEGDLDRAINLRSEVDYRHFSWENVRALPPATWGAPLIHV